MLDLKKLTYLEAVYHYKSFTKASEALYISQPTISAAIASLEQEFGINLISRSSKNIIFTPEGKQFVQQVQRLLSMSNEAEKMMQDISTLATQQLRLGISQATTTFLVPKVYSKFVVDNPRAQIQFVEGDMYTHIDALKNESLDLVFNGLPDIYEAENLETIPVCSSRLHAVFSSVHPYAKMKTIPLELLAKEELAILGTTSRTSSTLLGAFERAGFVPKVTFSCNHYSCLIEVLSICDYMGVLNVVDGQPFPRYRGFALRPIEAVDPIPIGFIYKKGKYLSKLSKKFISFIKQVYLTE